MTLDNSAVIAGFVPETFDGDTFLYTELLNRSRKSGNNKGRRLRTFYHRDRHEFLAQIPDIRLWCDLTGARAYTRLAPRSFKKVGQLYAKHILEQALTANWEGMRHGYAHACGISSPLRKLWLWDVDDREPRPDLLGHPRFVATIPSRKGYHVITEPFDPRTVNDPSVSLHKDNPTNLYIPDGAP